MIIVPQTGAAQKLGSGGRSLHQKCHFLHYRHVFVLDIISLSCFFNCGDERRVKVWAARRVQNPVQ